MGLFEEIKKWFAVEDKSKETAEDKLKNICRVHQSTAEATRCSKCGRFMCIECDIIKADKGNVYCEECLMEIRKKIDQVFSKGKVCETYSNLGLYTKEIFHSSGLLYENMYDVVWGITPEDEVLLCSAFFRYPSLARQKVNCKTGSDDEHLILKKWHELPLSISFNIQEKEISVDMFFAYNEMQLSIKKDILIATIEYPHLINDINEKFYVCGGEMINLDRQIKLIYLVLETLPYIREIILSFYCQAVDRKGHIHQICYNSCRVLREVAEDINRELIGPVTIIGNFDNRIGCDFDKGKLFQVQPFEDGGVDLLAKQLISQEIEEKPFTPEDFEVKVQILFEKMGFKTEITKKTGDGGIDVIAHNINPIIKGKYIIQCKYYQEGNNVGESVVRELFGVVHAENAVKGIIATTSDFTRSAKAFAEDKPLELINGRTLQALFNQYFGQEN